MLSPCLSKPQRGAGVTSCLAGTTASGSLARTVSVPSAPGGHPISTQHTALLVSRWHCLILLKGSFPRVTTSSFVALPGAGRGQQKACFVPATGRHLMGPRAPALG